MKGLNFYLILPVLSGLLLASCSKKSVDGSATVDATSTSTIKYIDTLPDNTPLKHQGGLPTNADFVRIKANLTIDPWLSGWNKLIANSHSQLTYNASPTVKLIRGGNTAEEPQP